MAQLAKTPAPGDWSFDGENAMKRHEEQFAKLHEAAALVDPAVSLVGAIVSFPWADGSAMYLVSKDKPLTLQPIPYMDAWTVPDWQIRGLRKADVVSMIRSDLAMRKLFS